MNDNLSGSLCANQVACMDYVNSLVSEFPTGFFGLQDALLRKINVNPSGEPILSIPNRLPMAYQNQFRQLKHLEFSPTSRLMETQLALQSPGSPH